MTSLLEGRIFVGLQIPFTCCIQAHSAKSQIPFLGEQQDFA